MPAFLHTELRDGALWVTLSRPDVHNAFEPGMIENLRHIFTEAAPDPAVRAVVLAAEGRSFSAGADLSWMQRTAQLDYTENMADAQRMAAMFSAIEACPRPVIARVQGAAFGGGAGLVAAADIAIAADSASFGFTEARIGLIPAVIAPFVVRRIGEGQARRLFLTARRIPAAEALRLGLVHRVVPAEELDAAVEEELAMVRGCGPQALADIKALLLAMRATTPEREAQETARRIALSRIAPEGQAGLRAFLEKRPSPWQDGEQQQAS